MQTIQKLPYKGYKICVCQDDEAESPREWADNIGVMYCHHRRYILGDQHKMSMEDVEEMVRDTETYISLPVYLYDHSGLCLSVGTFADRLDSGKIGYIVAERGHNGMTDEHIRESLEAEIKIYSYYVSGAVHCYEVLDSDGDRVDITGSGFYGSNDEENGLIEDACCQIDNEIERVKKETEERRKRQEGKDILTAANLISVVKLLSKELSDKRLKVIGNDVDLFPEQVREVLNAVDTLVVKEVG
jgi:hypothetical protein